VTTGPRRTTVAWRPVVVGAVCGLAWGSGLRGWMAELAGRSTSFSPGSFLALILPSAVVGALLGWAWHLHRLDAGRRWWLSFSPLLLGLAPLLMPGAIASLLSEGLGGGALWVAAGGVLGGHALGSHGGRVPRWVTGVLAFVVVVGTGVAGPAVAPATDPLRVAWIGLYGAVFVVVLALAASLPFRLRTPAAAPAGPAAPRSPGGVRAV
jgi:hypothetical protein